MQFKKTAALFVTKDIESLQSNVSHFLKFLWHYGRIINGSANFSKKKNHNISCHLFSVLQLGPNHLLL